MANALNTCISSGLSRVFPGFVHSFYPRVTSGHSMNLSCGGCLANESTMIPLYDLSIILSEICVLITFSEPRAFFLKIWSSPAKEPHVHAFERVFVGYQCHAVGNIL